MGPEIGVGRAQEFQHRDVGDVVHVAAREETRVDALRVLREHLGGDDVVDVALDGVELEILGRREIYAEARGAHDFGQATAVVAEGGVGVVRVRPDRAGKKYDEGNRSPTTVFGRGAEEEECEPLRKKQRDHWLGEHREFKKTEVLAFVKKIEPEKQHQRAEVASGRAFADVFPGSHHHENQEPKTERDQERDQRVGADDAEGVQAEKHRQERRHERPGEEHEAAALVVDFRHRAETGGTHGLHDQGVDELVGVGRDQQERQRRDATDEERVAVENRAIRVAQPQRADADAERHERRDFRVINRQAARDKTAEGEFAPRHVARGEQHRGRREQDGDTADLGDELVKRPEAEERARGEEEKRDQRDLAVATLENGNRTERENLQHAQHQDRRHERLVRLQPCQRGDPRHGEFGARPDLLQAVHEPVMLRVVAALEIGLQREVVVAVVEEALGRQAVVGHVVVAVGDPVEAEADRGPADVEQINADDAKKRRELTPGQFRPAPDENPHRCHEQPERQPRTRLADGNTPDVEARDENDYEREADGRRDEPAPQHAEARSQERDDGLADKREVKKRPKDEEQCDHAGVKILKR